MSMGRLGFLLGINIEGSIEWRAAAYRHCTGGFWSGLLPPPMRLEGQSYYPWRVDLIEPFFKDLKDVSGVFDYFREIRSGILKCGEIFALPDVS